MTHEYFCRAYRLELFSAMCAIEAETQAEAMRKLKQMEEDGELDFEGFCEGEPANELVVEPRAGDADDLTEYFPENSLCSQRRINAAFLGALIIAEDFMSGFEGDVLQEGIAEKLAIVRSAIINAKVRS